MAKLLGNQGPVETKIGEVTQGIGFEQLPVDEVVSGEGLENPVAFIEYQNSNPNPMYLEGRVFYDQDKHALSYYNNESETTINLGQETVFEVVNNSGALIPNGKAVLVTGTSGGLPEINLAIANTVENANVAGVTTHDIPNTETGYITIFGSVGGVDTSGYTAGDILYLSSSVGGDLTNLEQQILSPVALVLTTNQDGTIVVNPRGVINRTALGQVFKAAGAVTQAITTTPVPLAVFENTSNPNLNITPTFVAASGQFEAKFSPETPGDSGFYQVTLSISGNYTSNTTDVILTLNINGSPTELATFVPFDGLGNGDPGSATFTGITEVPIVNTDVVEWYVQSSGGSGTFTCTTCYYSIQRLGNA